MSITYVWVVMIVFLDLLVFVWCMSLEIDCVVPFLGSVASVSFRW